MSASLRIALLFLASVIVACGHAHAVVHVPAANPASFKQVQIGTVSVVSIDKNAAQNAELQEKVRAWNALADQQLRQTLMATNAQIVETSAAGAPIVSLTSEVEYGNRALRWIGYGAGKGGVSSRLVAKDGSGATLFEASAKSDLAIGAAGGSIDKVFRKNLDELFQKYRESLTRS